VKGGQRRPPAVGGDIPMARRSTPRLAPANPWPLRLTAVAGGLLVFAAALALVFPQPLRRWLAAPPVPGLEARPDSDGRLLGHFPYSEAAGGDLVEVVGGQRLQRDAAAALNAMRTTAREDGVELVVLSAFRSVREQRDLFFDVKSARNQSARERAQVSAPPGYSEHATGYAVDLGDGRAPATNLAQSFEHTDAYRWLRAHGHRFHFTLSFPRRNPQGVSYEPWHWRFEGTEAALRTFARAEDLAGR
jgi:D-alanyl-D-alanine carboxypeptidase